VSRCGGTLLTLRTLWDRTLLTFIAVSDSSCVASYRYHLALLLMASGIWLSYKLAERKARPGNQVKATLHEVILHESPAWNTLWVSNLFLHVDLGHSPWLNSNQSFKISLCFDWPHAWSVHLRFIQFARASSEGCQSASLSLRHQQY
jgi:hypothetical protein